MPHLENLAVGESYTIGGAGINGVSIGPLHLRARVEVYAWHTGYKQGEGNSAELKLFRDGVEVQSARDANFDNYNLPCSAVFELGTGASTSLSIQITNHMAATRQFGIQAVLTGLSVP